MDNKPFELLNNQWQTKNSLKGKLLIAMPNLNDSNFRRAVIFVCAHNHEGAMGLVINHVSEDLSLDQLIVQLNLAEKMSKSWRNIKKRFPDEQDIHTNLSIVNGGPVEPSRGFVLHSRDIEFNRESLNVTDDLALTASVDMLFAIRSNQGPKKALLALGYVGWNAGQLERELDDNVWLDAHAELDLIFNPDIGAKYDLTLASLGINPVHFVSSTGHA